MGLAVFGNCTPFSVLLLRDFSFFGSLFVARRDGEKGRRNRKVVLLDRSIGDAIRCTADIAEAAKELVVHQEVTDCPMIQEMCKCAE